jgi:hypothetical protein
MKKALLYFLLAIAILPGCSKDDDPVFDQTPDERVNEAISKAESTLKGAADGWNARVVTGTGSTFQFHFRFNEGNRVVMYADIDTSTAGSSRESSYRLKALQQPALIFDTYSYLHILADPDGSVNGGEDGQGLKSDFEFAIDTVTADSILLTGRYYGTRVTLYKATSADAAAWQNGEWRNALSFQYMSRILEYFKRLPVNGTTYEIYFNQQSRTITFIWTDSGGTVHTFSSGYYYNSKGLVLINPLSNGNASISTITSRGWDAVAGVMRVSVNDAITSAVSGATRPVKPDVDAPTRWWQTIYVQDTYWVSLTGFHVNGVDDAFGVRNIPGYAFLLFWAAFGTQSGVTYDLQGYVSQQPDGLSLDFGSAWLPPQFTSDGRVIFRIYGTLGDVPAAATNAFNNTNAVMADPNGFYLVQTGNSRYDMVSARDARSWITWER